MTYARHVNNHLLLLGVAAGVMLLLSRLADEEPRKSWASILLLGTTTGHLGASSYWAHVLNTVAGAPPPVDLEAERRLVDLLVAAAEGSLLVSAHDLSEGGLGVSLAEACIGGPYAEAPFGARIDLRDLQGSLPGEALFFGEDHGRAVVSVALRHRDQLLALSRRHRVPAAVVGTVGEKMARLDVTLRDGTLRAASGELRSIYYSAIPRRMELVVTQDAAD